MQATKLVSITSRDGLLYALDDLGGLWRGSNNGHGGFVWCKLTTSNPFTTR